MAEIISDSKAAEANQVVRKYMLGALAPGIVAIPWVDLALMTGLQLKMIHRLAELYGVKFSSEIGKSLIASLVGAGVSMRLSSYFIPLVGHLMGMIGTSLFGGASTYAVGKVFILHFESGGTLLTFDANKMREYYAEQFAAAKVELQQSFAGVRP
jgi:uncharacterized protein (DUF697 family)